METYYETSIYAYHVLREVSDILKINEAPRISLLNGNANKIISTCNKIIEAKFNEKRMRELIKYYIAHSFFEDYDLESDDDYSNELLN